MLYRTAPRYAARLRRVLLPYRWLPIAVQRRLLRQLPRSRRGHEPAGSERSARWLRLLAGIMVMAALFSVLLSAAEPEGATASPNGSAQAAPARSGLAFVR